MGICGSNRHAYHGHDPRRKPGLVPGHVFCGTMEGMTRSGAFADLMSIPAASLIGMPQDLSAVQPGLRMPKFPDRSHPAAMACPGAESLC